MTEQVFFRSDGKVYEVVEVDQISLRDVITFPRDAAAVLGEEMSWSQAQSLTQELQALDPDVRDDHPMAPFVLAVVIWSSRRAAGDAITFGECLDASFEWVEVKQPGDRKPGKRNGAKRAPAKKSAKRPPRASAPDVEQPTDQALLET